MAFRTIGRGRSAATKFCSIMNISPPITSQHWAGHTKFYDGVVDKVLEEELSKAAWDVKCFKREVGEFSRFSDKELKQLTVDAAITIDGSWSSRGWTSRDGIVAVISVDTGKVLDVIYLSSTCKQCEQMEKRKDAGEITPLEYMEWYIKHDDDCYLNHDGSSSVRRTEVNFSWIVWDSPF